MMMLAMRMRASEGRAQPRGADHGMNLHGLAGSDIASPTMTVNGQAGAVDLRLRSAGCIVETQRRHRTTDGAAEQSTS